jgi:hypothetical protein
VPGYARARLAHELRDLLAELGAQVERENDLAGGGSSVVPDRAWAAGDHAGPSSRSDQLNRCSEGCKTRLPSPTATETHVHSLNSNEKTSRNRNEP